LGEWESDSPGIAGGKRWEVIFLDKFGIIYAMSTYLVVGTWNTKHEELDFLCREIATKGYTPVKLDVSSTRFTDARDTAIDGAINRAKGELKDIMKRHRVAGMVAVGGGTLLYMAVRIMEDVPLLIPKVIVSTMVVNSLGVFGNHKDIVYLQSPCDFGALNPLSEAVLTNAANIVTAMTSGLPRMDGRAVAITAIGITGVYTEAVKAFWRGKGLALVPFHSAGESTMAMAELAARGFFHGILDLTLHDVLDHIARGTYGHINEERLASYLSRDIPAVMSPGAVDAVAYVPGNGGVPSRFRKRNVYRHDFRWTFKATGREAAEVGRWIGKIVAKHAPERARFLIPLKGWSYPGEVGKSFYDPRVMSAFTTQLEKYVGKGHIESVDLSINDPAFGIMASQRLYDLMEGTWRT
jgi:uncharacterized protein (UPF0261 family)